MECVDIALCDKIDLMQATLVSTMETQTSIIVTYLGLIIVLTGVYLGLRAIYNIFKAYVLF